jgi:putative ABC transport system permease protein
MSDVDQLPRGSRAPAGAPPGRPTRTSVWRLPPWTRAPWLGLLSPAAVVAVLVTSAILACAVASAPLFLSSARSAALQQQLAPQCVEAGWPTTGATFGVPPDQGDPFRQIADHFSQAWTSLGHHSDRVLEVGAAVGRAGSMQMGLPVTAADGSLLTLPATLFWRPGVTAHVHAISPSAASGVWLPATYAKSAHARVGDRIGIAGATVTVAGIYTDLYDTAFSSYWCDYVGLFQNLASSNNAPPPLVLATDQATVFRIAAAARFLTVMQRVPVEHTTLSSARARALLDQQQRAQTGALRGMDLYPQVNTDLPEAVSRASLIERGLRGPVIPVAVAGGLLALVLVASAGSFWADRRATEVRLLAARGVGPVPLAGKAALELALPALVGAALGWGVSRLLIAGVGPANDLDPSATRAAVLAGVGAFVAGLGCAAGVAGLRARGTAERPLGAAPRWPSRVPWELTLLVAAGWCWALLDNRKALVVDHGVAQVNGLLVAFPLLGIAGAAVLLARLLTQLLPVLRRWADRRSPAVFLAVNRLAAARLATSTLLVAVTLPVAVLGYTATLTASSHTTIDAKTGLQIGAGHALRSVSRITPDARTNAVGTVVDRYDGTATVTDDSGSLRGPVQVLAVDTRTFARTAYWQDGFADESLADLVHELTRPVIDGRLPVVAMGLPAGDPQLRVGTKPVGAQVVATARVLPGRRSAIPLVLVDRNRLPAIPREAGSGRTSELWTNGPVDAATKAALEAGARAPVPTGPQDVFTTANFLGISWTFGYLSALAVFVGVIAVGGLLLYLEARSRTRLSGYVMGRRLGLGKGAHLRSLLAELGGVAVAGLLLGAVLAAAAVAVVYRRLDVDLLRPPTPLLDVPWLAVLLTAVVTVLVAVAAAGYAQRAADRADPATVLREDA